MTIWWFFHRKPAKNGEIWSKLLKNDQYLVKKKAFFENLNARYPGRPRDKIAQIRVKSLLFGYSLEQTHRRDALFSFDVWKIQFQGQFWPKTAFFWSKSRYFDMIMTSSPKIRPLRAKYGTHTLLVMLKLTVKVFFELLIKKILPKKSFFRFETSKMDFFHTFAPIWIIVGVSHRNFLSLLYSL